MQNSGSTDHIEHIATLYRFCAQSMQYPDALWLTDKYFSSLNTLLNTLGGHEEVILLQKGIDESSDYLEDLQVEYTRLFINGVPHVAAPPYASVYLEQTLKGKYSEEVVLFYQSHGYTLTQNADLPDSLIHQLEFLSFLAEDQNHTGEEAFLKRFFLPWFSQFSTQVKKEAQHPFYQIIISIIEFFTKEEEEYGVQLNEA